MVKSGESPDQLPTLSIVIPTYNEERNIDRCLQSIFTQRYPQHSLEVIIVDDHSTDRTIEFAKTYDVRVLYSGMRDAELSKMIGLKEAQSDFFLYLDADIELVGPDWIAHILRPLLENDDVVGAFPRFLPRKDDAAIGRFLRYHPLELDPVLEFFCTDIDETVERKAQGYSVCKFTPPKVPPIGICVYRRDILWRIIGRMRRFMDIDVPVILSENGYAKFAYVPECGIYHSNVRTIMDLVNRRLRNLHTIFLPDVENRRFRYFELSDPKALRRILLWIVYANSVLPSVIKGIYKTIEHRDIACMCEAPASIMLTDLLVWGFMHDEKGRRLLMTGLRHLLASRG